jgi:hypothetical protein
MKFSVANRLLPLFIAAGLGGSLAEARASLINGDFSQGLTSWQVTDPGTVTVASNVATIVESQKFSETDLFQDFKFPSSTKGISFKITDLFADTAVVNGKTPDGFGVSLVDSGTLLPIGPVVAGTTDSFYIRDLTTAATPVESWASNVTVSPAGSSTFPITVKFDLSSLSGLDGTNGRLLFRVIGGSDLDSLSSVSISDVTLDVGQGTSTIPEPLSLVVWSLLGMAACGWRFCRQRKPPVT